MTEETSKVEATLIEMGREGFRIIVSVSYEKIERALYVRIRHFFSEWGKPFKEDAALFAGAEQSLESGTADEAQLARETIKQIHARVIEQLMKMNELVLEMRTLYETDKSVAGVSMILNEHGAIILGRYVEVKEELGRFDSV